MLLKAKMAQVIRDHEPPDTLPLTLSPGDRVLIKHPHPERSGFVWAEDGIMSAGWVPLEVLDGHSGQAHATAEFNSSEIAVRAGEPVRLYWEAHGAWWCENRDGDRGWVPSACIAVPIDEPEEP